MIRSLTLATVVVGFSVRRTAPKIPIATSRSRAMTGAIQGFRPREVPSISTAGLAKIATPRNVRPHRPISDAAWAEFLATIVTPRFPDGLTVLDGYGQWRNPSTGEIGHEASTLVEIVTSDTTETAARLEQIRDAYKTRFGQQSVGLVTTASCAAF